jgi:hypothetical protein
LGIDELIYGYLTYHDRFPLNEGISCVWEILSRNGMMKETTLLDLSEDMEIDQIPHHGDGTCGLGDLNQLSVLLSALFTVFVLHP